MRARATTSVRPVAASKLISESAQLELRVGVHSDQVTRWRHDTGIWYYWSTRQLEMPYYRTVLVTVTVTLTVEVRSSVLPP